MSVRQRLAAATDDVHQALHRAAPFARIVDGKIDRKEYGAVLGMLLRYHGALHGACVRGAMALGLPQLSDAHTARIAALTGDLEFLGQRVLHTEAESVADDAFAIGCLYTVQGSTLGGKVIARQLDRLLDGEDGRRFFRGAADDGANWQALCAGLETRGADFARLEAGARHAFARFAELLAPV